MSTLIRSITLISALIVVAACSTNKDRFVNRNFHAVTTEYNILYNGDLALEQGKEELRANYKDNYWEILPVERMQVSEEVMLPGQSKNQNFQTAEEKAAKAIQRHSMYIDGTEVNPQMDEAFLLLGKARYYDQRFIPALEAFNYILHKYPTSNNITHARIWREKTHMRLDNNELAIGNLKKILTDSTSLEKEDLADAFATLSQAYINLNSIDSAVAPIKKAAYYAKENEEKGRYYFIKGQLYDELGIIDSANMAFDEVINLNRKSPRVYMMNAYMEKAKNFDYNNSDKTALLDLLRELREDRENRPFLDLIHHQFGEYYLKQDSAEIAIKNYDRSLRTKTENDYLHAQNYVTIANIYFDDQKYKPASSYYDSTLTKLNKSSREYRFVKRKRDNLEDVVNYEDIATRNDSILQLTRLNEEERLAFFTEYTELLKTQDNKEQKKQDGNSDETGGFNSSMGSPSRSSSFYFYNSSAVNYGRLEFQRVWGGISLSDNWRLSPQQAGKSEQEVLAAEQDSATSLDPKYHPGTYIGSIPDDPTVIDSIQKEKNFANYQLGVIYKEKFTEYQLAAEKFEELLSDQPEERLVLPSKYNLYKIYLELGLSSQAEKYKNDILENHSDSRYASIILNPESLLEEKNTPAEVYSRLYKRFENEDFQRVIDSSEIYTTKYTGDDIVPKFEFLKAMATGRLYGFESYKEALNHVALTYPQSDEGKKAQKMLDTAIPALAYSKFGDEDKASDFKLLYPFTNLEKEEAIAFEKKLQKAIAQEGLEGLETSVDLYSQNQLFVVIHNLKSSLGAKGLAERLVANEKNEINRDSYPISTSNYKIILIHKNFEKYLTSK